MQSNSGDILAGSARGLYIFNSLNYTYQHVYDPAVVQNNDLVTCIFEEDTGRIWLGTYYSGIKQLYYTTLENNKISTQYRYYRHNPDDSRSLRDNIIESIYEDKYVLPVWYILPIIAFHFY